MKSFKYKHILLVVLFLLICVMGAVLRLRNVDHNLEFFGDTDRDVLVAKHVNKERKFTTAYPAAYGGEALLTNSPHYFNLLAILYALGKSPEGTVFILALISSLAVPCAFILGRSLGGNRLALGLALVVATNVQLLSSSQRIYQPDILVTLTTFASCFFLVGLKKKSNGLLTIAAFLYTLGLHIHYSVLPILVPVLLILIVFGVQQKKNTTFESFAAFIPMITFLSMVGFWLFTINGEVPLSNGLFKFLNKIFFSLGQSDSERTTLINRVISFMYGIYRSMNIWTNLLTVSSITVLLFQAFMERKKTWMENSPLMLMLVFSSILFTAFSKVVIFSYYSPYFFIFLIFLAYSIWLVTRKVHVIFFVFGISILVSIWLKQSYEIYFVPRSSDQLSHRQSIKNATILLINDAAQNSSSSEKINIEDVMIIDRSSTQMFLGWAQPAYYFALEEISGKDLVTINTSFEGWTHNNIRPKFKAKVIYLLCTEDYEEQRIEDIIKKECLDSFEQHINNESTITRYYNLVGDIRYEKMIQPITVVGLKTYVYKFSAKPADTE